MKSITSIDGWRAYCEDVRRAGGRVGLVATMGALHDGHASLFERARRDGTVVVATIFVNPRQFGDDHDLQSYPRTPRGDRATARRHGVDCLVEPRLDEMWPDYPRPTATTVSVRGVADGYEGAGRPGHFDGVASVVAKLLAITGPCAAYFGEKDFQQVAVVRAMVRDLGFAVTVVACPIVREPDGLALSSRNRRLSPQGRERATALSRALARAASVPAPASVVRATLRATLEEAGVTVAYADVVDPARVVASSDDESGERRALVAGIIDGVRLIDNGPVTLVAREA